MRHLTELPYHADTAARFAPLARQPWAVFLDSAREAGGVGTGRYDIIAADPSMTLVTRGDVTEIRTPRGASRSLDDPFDLVRKALGDPCAPTTPPLPFGGGAIGWFGYDLGRRIERLPCRAEDAEGIPDMAVGIYDWALVVDHVERRSWLVGAGRDPRTRMRWPGLVSCFARRPVRPPADAGPPGTGPVRSNMTRTRYLEAVRQIRRYILEGDCYQVNLSQRFAAPALRDAWSAYTRLRTLNPAPFSAYLSSPFAQVLSSSPERFLALRGGRVETRPIKGTRPRGSDPEADAARARALAGSPKDRAENLMIVDLLRNDLGRVCRPGTIRVPALFAVETYATVHHLVSVVTGELADGEDACSLLRACFPGGSVTGAPKIRAMEIIEELEPHRRGVYCGAIGYLGFDGDMDTSIAIRTLVNSGGTVRFSAGGGVVHDSVAEEEYRETFDKAAALLRLLGGGPVGQPGR